MQKDSYDIILNYNEIIKNHKLIIIQTFKEKYPYKQKNLTISQNLLVNKITDTFKNNS